jgi:hypothetical protein
MKLLTSLAAVLALVVSVDAADEKKPAAAGDKPKPDPTAIFGKKDANADGKLSKEEFVGKKPKDAAKAEAAFAAKDKDKDGFVSKEEFMAPGGRKKK